MSNLRHTHIVVCSLIDCDSQLVLWPSVTSNVHCSQSWLNLAVAMDHGNDMTANVNCGGSCGNTTLPKFNHLYPILFFSQFIRFCGANKCGGQLSSPDGQIESIVTLEDSHVVEEAEMPSPSRASVAADGTPQPRSRGAGSRSSQIVYFCTSISGEEWSALTQKLHSAIFTHP